MSQNQSYAFVVSMMGNTKVTYSYNEVDDAGNIIKSNNRNSFVVLSTDTDVTNAISVINNAINTRLNPEVQITYGNITVKYQSNGVDLETPTVNNNLSLATYVYNAKIFNGYNLSSRTTATATLDENNLNATIIFTYEPIIKGSVVIKYQDENGADIIAYDTYNNLDMGNYTYNNKDLSSQYYELVDSTQSSKLIQLTTNNPNATVIFTYKKITGSITINYLDGVGNILSPQSVNNNLTVGQSYTYSLITIAGYNTTDIDKNITITSDNLNQVINFTYTQIKGTLTVKYKNSTDNTDIATEKVLNNLDWNSYTENAIGIDGYTISGDNTQTVTINADNLNPTIIFKYSQNPA